MKDIVADAIRFYYEENHDAVYVRQSLASLHAADVIAETITEFAEEVELPDGDAFWPSYEVRASFGTYSHGLFEGQFDTVILVSKLVRFFHVLHGFSIENRHDQRVLPELDGVGNTGFITKQFDMHEALRQRLVEQDYTELDLPDMREIIPTLSFPPGVAIFGRQVSVRFALFHDLRGLCPEE